MRTKLQRNFHLPLPETLHARLRAEAARSGRPTTTLAREAIETWIEERERQAMYEAIAAYASEMAGTPADLDQGLERAAIEHLSARKKR